ncbi:MAG TPA: VOC family protein [Caulobacteraceae bacterium]|jgi:predicted 3-demethylubiquinone-9 3-methyltransferase (glyoxalase superfamily)
MLKVTPFLWFDTEAEDAAKLYVSLFPNSKITNVARYNAAGPGEPGAVMTVSFELDGLPVTALNGGPMFKFTEAMSFWVSCDDQAEVDHYWDALLADGGQPSQCGWLKDRFGFSWQIVPQRLMQLLADPDRAKAARATQAMLKMQKFDLAALEAAASG